METLKQCSERVLQLQERIAQLERENERLQAENIQLQAENQTLRASEARYRKCFENSPISMVFVASDGRPVQANQAFERLYRMPLEQLKEHNFNVFHDPQLVENGSIVYIRQAFAGETVIEPPTYYDGAKTVSGGRFSWNQALYFPIRDEAGVVQEIVEACLDLTELYDAQQALLQEQAAIAQEARALRFAREREAAALEQAVKLENVNAIMRDSVRQLSNEADIDTFLGYVLTKIAQQIEANYISLFRYDDSNHTLTLHLSYLDGNLRKGTSGDELELWAAPFPADITPAFELMCQYKQFFTPTMSPIPPEEFGWPGALEWLSQIQATEAAHLVLFVGNNPVGSMGLTFTNGKTLQEKDQPLVLALAQQCAIALRLWALAERSQQAAMPDRACATRIAREQEKVAQERIVELAKTNEELRQRDRILEAGATAANALLTIDNFEQAVNTALQTIGKALDTDRITVIEILGSQSQQSSEFWKVLYEWDSPDTIPQISHPDVVQGNFEAIEEWYELLIKGQSISYMLEEMPEPFRSGQAKLGVKALHAVPIFVEGKLWGVVGFDDCREAKRRSPAEFAVLRIAADCIGSAIQRQRIQQALLRTEQERVAELTTANESLQQRECLLCVVAQITKDMLEAEDADAAIPVALRAVGEVANISRVLLILERQDPSTQRLKHCVAYEWVAAGITDRDSVGMSVMDNDDFQFLIQSLYKGQSVWRVMDDLPDVTRVQFETLEIKSTGAVPIFIEGHYTGCVAFDDCVVPRHWSQQEIDVLTAAADSIGAALHRKQLVERLIEERGRAAEERAAELAEINAALSASEARLRTLFEQLPVSLQIFSDSGICLEVNRAWSELWQLPSSAVIGKSCLVTSLNPSSQLPSPFTPYLQRCFAGEPVVVPPLFFEPVTTFKAGRARWVQTYIYPIKDQANVLREVLLIHQDIHALKQAYVVARGQTEALIQVLSALVSEPDIDQLLAQVMSITTAQLNAPASTLWLCDTETGDNLLHLVCCGDRVSRELPVRMRADIDSLCLLLDSQTWQQIERNRRPIVLTDIATHPALKHLRPWLMQQQVRVLMLVPLLLGNQMIGCVGIHNSTSNYFRSEEIELAQALAHQITLAIQLTQLAQQAKLSALLEERNRLAGEIHDTLAQTFTGISIQVDVAQRIVSLDPEEARKILARVSELAHLGLKEARRSVWALYSPTTEDEKLAQSLRHSVEQMTNDTSIQVEFNVEGTPCSLSMYVSQNLLRIGQEALTNILKHANAGAIWIELVYESEYVCLSVRDNGRGFVLSAANNNLGAGFGLIGMYQRAERIGGQLTITTQPGQGTEIFVRVPVS